MKGTRLIEVKFDVAGVLHHVTNFNFSAIKY
jgi:hypothetical protein